MTPSAHRPADLILWDVVEEHFEEAAFLFSHWNRALHSPVFTLSELRRTFELRLEAHLDGLVVGGPEVSTRILFPELAKQEEPARVTVAALALLAGGQTDWVSRSVVSPAIARALALSGAAEMDLENAAPAEGSPHEYEEIWMLGFRGTVEAGDTCIRHLQSKDERVAKAAAESLAWITGLELQDRRFKVKPPEPDGLPTFDEDNLDANLEADGLDAVPSPNRDAIARWWDENRARFAQHPRWIMGHPFSNPAIIHTLKAGPLWRRHGLASELFTRAGGQQRVSTDAFSKRQLREIAALEANLNVVGDELYAL